MAFGAQALLAEAARHVAEQHARRHQPRRVLRIRQRVQVHDRRANRGREVDRTAVVADQQVGLGDQRREFTHARHPRREHQASGGGGRQVRRGQRPDRLLDQGLLARPAAHDDRGRAIALAVRTARAGARRHRLPQQAGGFAQAVGRIAPRQRARARMHDHEGLARSHARRDQALTNRLAVALEHAKAQALIARAQAHRAHQVQLAADLMAHAVADLVAIGNLVAQQAIGALAGMAQHPGNAGEPAHRRRRKHALRADGEDDGRVIVLIGPLREGLALHPPRRQAASRQRVGAGLHPRRMEADDAVHLRQMRRQRRHRRRGQQRQLSLRQ